MKESGKDKAESTLTDEITFQMSTLQHNSESTLRESQAVPQRGGSTKGQEVAAFKVALIK